MREPLTYTHRDFLRATEAQHKLGHNWYYFPDWNMSILAPPKCGSSSIKQFFWMNELDVVPIKHHEVTGDVYFVVRDPVSRFCSLWRSKCRDKGHTKHNNVLHGASPNELMSFIESGAKDVHFTPQYKLIGNLKPTIIPLEKLNEWWLNQGYGELGVFNKTDNELPDINPKRIVDFYARDMEMYAKAVLDYVSQNTHDTKL